MNILKCFNLSDNYYNSSHWVGHEGVDCNENEAENGFPGATCVFLEYGWALGGEVCFLFKKNYFHGNK